MMMRESLSEIAEEHRATFETCKCLVEESRRLRAEFHEIVQEAREKYNAAVSGSRSAEVHQ